ncbi:MAG: cation transporter [Bacteroidales bacterium]|nr:cation transporter [Bacteroidales bacterium]
MKKILFALLGIILIAATNTEAYAQKKVTKTAVFEVSVHCKSCKAKIERDIAFEKGVKEVTASVDKKLVTVKYDENKTTPEKIAEAIKKLGYEVKEVDKKKKS